MNYPQRVVFPKGEQQKFLEDLEKKFECGTYELSKIAGTCQRTIADLKREKFTMSLVVLQKLCHKAEVPLPQSITIKDPFWYAAHGGELGWRTVVKKYGKVPSDPIYRKRKWEEWWQKEGRFQKHPMLQPKVIRKPLYSKDLAEFVGIVMGDGGITNRQVTVTLHKHLDLAYAMYVQVLMKKLFHTPVVIRMYDYENVLTLKISRSNLVRFCHDKLGLKIGNKVKQGIDIPEWIKKSPAFLKECIRGLVDTDGCVFYECHRIGKKEYRYPRINFCSASPPLIQSVFQGLKQLGMDPRIRNQGRGVQLESIEQIRHYCHVIGSHNLKHIAKLGPIGIK